MVTISCRNPCDCCEQPALEIKCPYCFKDGLPEGDAENFCMEKKEENGE